ncbi:MAG: hypothetical protein Pg6C_03660 [Treponemataceae bacterium]|nr:MAG: hypothetical protein Pg6C_03660 [Treponemataceae bacterium]
MIYIKRFYRITKKIRPILEAAKNRGRVFSEKSRSVYLILSKNFLSLSLKKNGVKTFAALTPPVIAKAQDCLLATGNKPASVNRYLGAVKAIFDHLMRDGVIKENRLTGCGC